MGSLSGFGHAMTFFSVPGTRLSRRARGAPGSLARSQLPFLSYLRLRDSLSARARARGHSLDSVQPEQHFCRLAAAALPLGFVKSIPISGDTRIYIYVCKNFFPAQVRMQSAALRQLRESGGAARKMRGRARARRWSIITALSDVTLIPEVRREKKAASIPTSR